MPWLPNCVPSYGNHCYLLTRTPPSCPSNVSSLSAGNVGLISQPFCMTLFLIGKFTRIFQLMETQIWEPEPETGWAARMCCPAPCPVTCRLWQGDWWGRPPGACFPGRAKSLLGKDRHPGEAWPVAIPAPRWGGAEAAPITGELLFLMFLIWPRSRELASEHGGETGPPHSNCLETLVKPG